MEVLRTGKWMYTGSENAEKKGDVGLLLSGTAGGEFNEELRNGTVRSDTLRYFEFSKL